MNITKYKHLPFDAAKFEARHLAGILLPDGSTRPIYYCDTLRDAVGNCRQWYLAVGYRGQEYLRPITEEMLDNGVVVLLEEEKVQKVYVVIFRTAVVGNVSLSFNTKEQAERYMKSPTSPAFASVHGPFELEVPCN